MQVGEVYEMLQTGSYRRYPCSAHKLSQGGQWSRIIRGELFEVREKKVVHEGAGYDHKLVTTSGQIFYTTLRSSNLWRKLSGLEILARRT